MKTRRLKKFVIPTIYVMTLTVIFISMVFLGSALTPEVDNSNDTLDYSVDSLLQDEVPVVSEVETKIARPYNSDKVTINKDYYSKEDDTTNQQNSLIYYQNTYLQNTGVLYTSDETFEVINVLDGKIKNITTDEIMGIVVEISHSNNLTSFYYSLSEVNFEIEAEIKTGEILGQSGNNKIENNTGSSLLYEVYYQGKAIDPETFLASDLSIYE